MANPKVDHQSVGSIAQAMKYQVRTGDAWDNLSGAAKESIDQILSSIARTVSSGQGVHWDGIMAYADAAKPRTDDPHAVPPPQDLPFSQRPRLGEIEHGISNLVRQMPRGENNER
jgi:hypothetical protein